MSVKITGDTLSDWAEKWRENPAKVLAEMAKHYGYPVNHKLINRLVAYCDELVDAPQRDTKPEPDTVEPQ